VGIKGPCDWGETQNHWCPVAHVYA
jgi:hypothetical protein